MKLSDLNGDMYLLFGLLGLSFVANLVLGYGLYQSEQITYLDTSNYKEFLSALNLAAESVDRSEKDTGEQQTQDVMTTNMNLEKAGGILSGLEPEFSRKGMQSEWIVGSLLNVTLSTPNNAGFLQDEKRVSDYLHRMNRELQGTEYSGAGLQKLGTEINVLNRSFMP